MTGLEPRCVSCGSPLAERQRWCLTCGAGAATPLAATPPRWAPFGAAAGVLALLALAAVVYVLAALIG